MCIPETRSVGHATAFSPRKLRPRSPTGAARRRRIFASDPTRHAAAPRRGATLLVDRQTRAARAYSVVVLCTILLSIAPRSGNHVDTSSSSFAAARPCFSAAAVARAPTIMQRRVPGPMAAARESVCSGKRGEMPGGNVSEKKTPERVVSESRKKRYPRE